MEFDNAKGAFKMVLVCKAFFDLGRIDKLSVELPLDVDFYWTIIYEALEAITDYVHIKRSEDDYWQTIFYQDPAMVEYYKLCRDYNDRHGIAMEANPYHQKAEAYVLSMLRGVGEPLGYIIKTKTHNKYSCRLGIEFDDNYFSSHEELILALLDIFSFYKEEVSSLRAVLQENCDKKEAA